MIAKLASSTTGVAHSQSQAGAANQQHRSTSNGLYNLTNANLDASNRSLSSASFVAGTIASSTTQFKKKRAKILDLLLNTNWSKQSQQASQLMKLNKLLLVCDANFIDEKTGESPLSLIVSSQQINYIQTPNHLTSSTLLGVGCAQSASLFNLQAAATTSASSPSPLSLTSQQQNSQMLLQQTNISDLVHSTAPLVERLILLFIKSGAQINFPNSDKRTPLHIAAIKSNLWALKTLLELGASQQLRDNNGLTPLYYSILHKADLKVTQLLLNNLSNNNRMMIPRCNQFASVSSRASVVSSVQHQHQQTNDGQTSHIGIVDQHGWQEVHQASKLGLDAHLDKLLYHGCDINAKISGSGNTPLHVAAINDQLNCAKVLLMRGADKTITNNSHQTAHQVAVIANNMDLAEFIAEHDESKVIPFNERLCHPNPSGANISLVATTINNGTQRSSTRSSISASTNSMASSQSSANFGKSFLTNPSTSSSTTATTDINQQPNYATSSSLPRNANIVQPMMQQSTCQTFQPPNLSHQMQQQPQQQLTLDIKQANMPCFNLPANGSNLLSNQHQHTRSGDAQSTPSPQLHHSTTTGMLSINPHSNNNNNNNIAPNKQLNVQVNNISPCLSQRSCATSNTTNTSSSGVCCDADGNNSTEELANGESSNGAHHQTRSHTSSHAQNQLVNSQSSHSNITVVAINGTLDHINHQPSTSLLSSSVSSNQLQRNNSINYSNNNNNNNNANQEEEEEEDLRSSDSSSNGLYSLMSDERPLFAGSIVKATSDYQSGDPNHLQLHVGDLIEVLECRPDLLQGGQLPRLANKPLLYGRRQTEQQLCGLFPSFCVRRTKQKSSHGTGSPRQRIVGAAPSHDSISANRTAHNNCAVGNSAADAKNNNNNYIAAMVSPLGDCRKQTSGDGGNINHALKLNYKEFQVTLTKSNEGFGFVLRGARIDPATLASSATANATATMAMNPSSSSSNNGKVVIDERLMAANNLLSLQYLDEIERASVAEKAGLKRGDFLVAVNQQDVRLCSHEQVVHLIRQSGNQVNLTIATLISHTATSSTAASTKTIARVKPEPPKRDPTTTLTRNKAQRVKSMFVQPTHSQFGQQQQQQSNRLRTMMNQDPNNQQQNGTGFDANKPLPSAPPNGAYLMSPTGSLNNALLQRSASTANNSHFNSTQSLSTGCGDSQSNLSVSTVNSTTSVDTNSAQQHAYQQQQQQQQLHLISPQHDDPNHSSTNSTTTLTTVATATRMKPVDTTTGIVSASQQQQQNKVANELSAMNNTNGVNRASLPSTTYQPAVITTTTKRDSIGSPTISTASPKQSLDHPAIHAIDSQTNIRSFDQQRLASVPNNTHQQQYPAPPSPPPPPPPPPLAPAQNATLPPPPPPPLPDFGSVASTANSIQDISAAKLNLRRTSAPAVNLGGFPTVNRLTRKRESLAVVGRGTGSGSSAAVNNPTEIGAVAAACAAAANNRLQRQKQLQQQEEEQQKKATEGKARNESETGSTGGMNQSNNVGKRLNNAPVISASAGHCAIDTASKEKLSTVEQTQIREQTVTARCNEVKQTTGTANPVDTGRQPMTVSSSKSEHQLATKENKPPPPLVTSDAVIESAAAAASQQQTSSPKRSQNANATNSHAIIGSATLGRKSSALIIQQPKTQQSQTLRAAKPNKRPSIPSYDEILPPPPPLPPTSSDHHHTVATHDEGPLANGAHLMAAQVMDNLDHTCYQPGRQTSHILRAHNQQQQQQQQYHRHHHHGTKHDELKHQYQQSAQMHHHHQLACSGQQRADDMCVAVQRNQRISHDFSQHHLGSQDLLINQQQLLLQQQQLRAQQQKVCQEKYGVEHQCNVIRAPTASQQAVVDASRDLQKLHHHQQVSHKHNTNNHLHNHPVHPHQHHQHHYHHHHHHPVQHQHQQQMQQQFMHHDTDAAQMHNLRSIHNNNQMQSVRPLHHIPNSCSYTSSPAANGHHESHHHHSHPHPHHNHHYHQHHHQQQLLLQQQQQLQSQHLLQQQRSMAASTLPSATTQQQYHLQQQQKYLDRHVPIGYISTTRNS